MCADAGRWMDCASLARGNRAISIAAPNRVRIDSPSACGLSHQLMPLGCPAGSLVWWYTCALPAAHEFVLQLMPIDAGPCNEWLSERTASMRSAGGTAASDWTASLPRGLLGKGCHPIEGNCVGTMTNAHDRYQEKAMDKHGTRTRLPCLSPDGSLWHLTLSKYPLT
jgi:hypothetical protein